MFTHWKANNSIFCFLLVCLISIFLGSCTPKTIEKKKLPDFVFYPTRPHPPKIQFLASLGNLPGISSRKRFVNLRSIASGTQQVSKPYDLSFFNEKLILCDSKAKGVWLVDIKNRSRRLWKLRGLKPSSKLVNVAIDDEGRIYLIDSQEEQIFIYNPKGRSVGWLGDIGKPVDVALFEDRVYILDIREQVVEIWDRNLNELIQKIGRPGQKNGEFRMPSGIAIDNKGFLYVADTGNSRVQKFDREGRFLMSIGRLGNRPGCFGHPKGVAVDRTGNIYVVDSLLRNIQIFDPKGNILLMFGELPVSEYRLNLPVRIILDYDHLDYFKRFVSKDFEIDYLIMVSNQLGPNKINVYGYGRPKEKSAQMTN